MNNDFFEDPDTMRLVNAYCARGVLRPIPGSDKQYDLAAHNLAMLVVREVRRRRHPEWVETKRERAEMKR